MARPLFAGALSKLFVNPPPQDALAARLPALAREYGRCMDYATYRDAYFAEPVPEQRFDLEGVKGITLYFAEYRDAVDYYTRVLGDPTYAEGDKTRGWRLGDTWLTLLAGGRGAPSGVEIPIIASSRAEAERLQQAFVDAGGSGAHGSDQLMYSPVHVCPVTDPFGTQILIYSRRPTP